MIETLNTNFPVDTVKRLTLYEQIADSLEEMIMKEKLKTESKLPSEQALAEEYNVSRPVIREALRLLKERGLVYSRNGAGSYLTKPKAENLSDVVSRIVVMDDISPREVYDIRILLEGKASRDAADYAKTDQMEKMQYILDEMRNHDISVQERRDLDYELHTAIAEASGNRMLRILIQMMSNVMKGQIIKGIYLEGTIDKAIQEHERVVNAIQVRNGSLAERMMCDHLTSAWRNEEIYNQTRKDE